MVFQPVQQHFSQIEPMAGEGKLGIFCYMKISVESRQYKKLTL